MHIPRPTARVAPPPTRPFAGRTMRPTGIVVVTNPQREPTQLHGTVVVPDAPPGWRFQLAIGQRNPRPLPTYLRWELTGTPPSAPLDGAGKTDATDPIAFLEATGPAGETAVVTIVPNTDPATPTSVPFATIRAAATAAPVAMRVVGMPRYGSVTVDGEEFVTRGHWEDAAETVYVIPAAVGHHAVVVTAPGGAWTAPGEIDLTAAGGTFTVHHDAPPPVETGTRQITVDGAPGGWSFSLEGESAAPIQLLGLPPVARAPAGGYTLVGEGPTGTFAGTVGIGAGDARVDFAAWRAAAHRTDLRVTLHGVQAGLTYSIRWRVVADPAPTEQSATLASSTLAFDTPPITPVTVVATGAAGQSAERTYNLGTTPGDVTIDVTTLAPGQSTARGWSTGAKVIAAATLAGAIGWGAWRYHTATATTRPNPSCRRAHRAALEF